MNDGFARTVPLGNLVDDVTVGHVGSMVAEYRASGVPFLRSTNIQPYRVDTSDLVYIGDSFHKHLRKSALRPGDLVVVRTGKPGTACVIPEDLGEANCADLVIIRPGGRADARFLAYFINGMAAGHVEAYAVGAVQQHFNIAEAKRLPVPDLEVDEQRAIADVLGVLDHKVELNRQINHTLEEMASSLFKSWFVDFDPVVARADGREPFGMDAATAALFPNGLSTDLPIGWPLHASDQFFDVLSGGTPARQQPLYWNGDVPWFSVVDAPKGSELFVHRTIECVTTEGIENSAANLYPAGTVIVTARGTVGKLAITGVPMAFNQSCYGLRARDGGGPGFVYLLAKSLVDEMQLMAHGSVFDTITRQTFASMKVPAPPSMIRDAFEAKVGDWFGLISSNVSESNTLTALRDALLPKLLSGEIRLKQAEKLVDAAL